MGKELHVVIIGAGFGGLSLARSLRKGPFKITIVDKENHHLFQPLLYQVASAGLSPGDIAIPIRSIFNSNENVHVRMAEVTGVDFARKEVALRDQKPIAYDYLVVAAGAETNYYGNDQWQPIAPGLKSIRDAVGIREKILEAFEKAELEEDPEKQRELLTFAVIGAGPTGVEMAGAIRELAQHTLRKEFRRFDPTKVRVLLVEKMDRVLAPFSTQLSQSARKQLEELGVEIRLGANVDSIGDHQISIDGTTYETSLVCWATGVKPVPLAAALGVPLLRGRIAVEDDCSVQGQPEVFAIGDIAAFVENGRGPLPGVAPVAIQQGRYLAKLMRDRLQGRPTKPFRYVDKGMMATIGRSRAVAETGKIKLSGTLAWLAWLAVHLLYLVGFRNRFIVLSNWVWSYLTYNRGSRLIAHHYRHRAPESKQSRPENNQMSASSPRLRAKLGS